eukprot:scaffold99315_cov24-Tisochrysis_lutea.AAC.1
MPPTQTFITMVLQGCMSERQAHFVSCRLHTTTFIRCWLAALSTSMKFKKLSSYRCLSYFFPSMRACITGDGGCMLCRGGKPLMLSQPHTAASASERERVQSVGGTGALTWHEKGGGHWRLSGSGLQ